MFPFFSFLCLRKLFYGADGVTGPSGPGPWPGIGDACGSGFGFWKGKLRKANKRKVIKTLQRNVFYFGARKAFDGLSKGFRRALDGQILEKKKMVGGIPLPLA
jgi:hypothetical protein